MAPKTTFALAAAVLLAAFLLLIPLPAQSYPFEIYTSEDGMIGTDVRSIHQDTKGYLWVGTQQGLSRFDGLEFTGFRPGTDFPGKTVYAIEEDVQGNIWVATERGVGRFDGQNWVHFTTDDGIIDNDVRSILADSSGKIWMATLNGVSCFDGSAWINYTEEEGIKGHYVLSILEDREGRLWFGTDAGVCRFDGDEWQEFTTRDGLAHDSVISMAEDSAGNLWFGSYEVGVSRFDGKEWTVFPLEETEASINVRSIIEDSLGDLWFTTGTGIRKYDGEEWTAIRPGNGLPSEHISAALEDREGNLWLGTREGLCRLPAAPIVNFTEEEGLSQNFVTAIFQDSQKNYWIGMNAGGVNRFDGKTWSSYLYRSPGQPRNTVVNWIIEDRKGHIWVTLAGQGVGRFDGRRWHFMDTSDGLAGNVVLSLLEDRNGNIWAGTWDKGVSRFDGGKWETFTTEDGLPSNNVNALLEDRNGVIWLGTYGGGLAGYDGTEWKILDTSNGLADDFLNTLFEDDRGILWIGSEQAGISRFDGSEFRIYTTDDGIASNTCYSIIQDGDYLYFGTSNGISRFDGEGFKSLTTEDGLISNNITHAVWKDDQGALWFGTKSGISKYTPLLDRSRPYPPPVYLERIHLLGSTDILQSGLELDHDENYLGFEYSGISFSSPQRLQYRFTLEGLDADWQTSKSRSIEYPNLPPGSYTFKVIADNREGVQSPQPASFSFTISSPFWGTWWFIMLSALLFLGVTYGVFREWHRLKTEKELKGINARLEANNLRLEEEIAERKKAEEELRLAQSKLIESEKMSAIGTLSAGIAHELNNPLMGITNYIQYSLKKLDQDSKLSSVLKNAERATKDCTTIVNNLLAFSHHDEIEHQDYTDVDFRKIVESVLGLLSYRIDKEGVTVKCEVEGPSSTLRADASKLQQVILNLAVNAIDSVEKSREKIVTFSMQSDKEKARITVEDSGCGIPPEKLSRIYDPFYTSKPVGKGTGLGLSVSYGIVKEHRGELKCESQVGRGTRFEIVLPASKQ